MKKYIQHILVPVDLSPCSENALNYAIELARSCKADLIVLNVQENLVSDEHLLDVKKETATKFRSFATKIDHAGDIKYKSFTTEGALKDEILTAIKEHNISLVVMGTNGIDKLDDIFPGTNTNDIIQHATCPVLSVPASAQHHPPTHITFATDYHTSDAGALNYLIELTGDEFTQINFLHIADEQQSLETEKRKMLEFIKDIEGHVKYPNLSFQLLSASTPQIGISDHLAANSADLLVLSTQHRGDFRRFIDPGITENIALHSQVPLLVFHHQQSTSVKLF